MTRSDLRASPVVFDIILKSNTQRFSNLVSMIVICVVMGLLIPLLVPIPFFVFAVVQIVQEPIRYRRTRRYRDDDAAALTVKIRGVFPGAPDITSAHLAKLVKTGRLTVDGRDGSSLRLILSDPVRLRKMRDCFAVRASFCPPDFGLGEFDRIMGDLVHSGPVAVAIGRIAAEERNELPTLTPAKQDYPEKPKKPVTEKPALNHPDDHKSDEFKEKQEAKRKGKAARKEKAVRQARIASGGFRL